MSPKPTQIRIFISFLVYFKNPDTYEVIFCIYAQGIWCRPFSGEFLRAILFVINVFHDPDANGLNS